VIIDLPWKAGIGRNYEERVRRVHPLSP
jgi:hypothetical protein